MPTTTGVLRRQLATALTLKSASGDGTITLTSVANGGYRESTKIDFGAIFKRGYIVTADLEFATAPTAGSYVEMWCNGSTSATAGTDNRGGCTGVDQTYTGYGTAADGVGQLLPVGSARLAAVATATVQKILMRQLWTPPQRYCSFVVLNNSGVAFHSSAANIVFTFTPIEDIIQDS